MFKRLSIHKQGGFTIVELLIVIVVIAVLAAISIVAYTGVQQRASNSAIIDAASKTYRLLSASIADKGSYPISSGRICITTESGCSNGTDTYQSGVTLDGNVSTLGTLPRSVPNTGSDRNGIVLYYGGQTLDSVPQPLLMYYFLAGNNQQCGLNNIVTYTWPDYTRSSTGYSGNAGDKTRCWVSVPGPSA